MKQTLVLLCIFGFVAVNALDTAIEDQVKSGAQEAVLVGEILREVAAQLAQDQDLSAEEDEYIIRHLWEHTKSAVKNATADIAAAAKSAYNEAKEHIKAAAKEAKAKAQAKALDIMSKIFSKFMETYALQDTNSRVDFVKAITANIEQVGTRLQKQGMSLLES